MGLKVRFYPSLGEQFETNFHQQIEMSEFAEILLEGVGPAIEHYDKVYDPVKERVKKIPKKIPGWKTRSGQDEYEEEDVVEYDYDKKDPGNSDRPREQEVVQYNTYEPPQRRDTERRARDDYESYDPPRRSNTERHVREDSEPYDPPRRSNTERPREHRSRHKSRHRSRHGGGRYVEEEYVYEKKGGRAKSVGRDGAYGGGGRGLRRDDRRRSRKASTVHVVNGVDRL